MKNLLSVTDLSPEEVLQILQLAIDLKKEYKTTGKNKPIFQNKTLVMLFEKPSLRTRMGFSIAMHQLGGNSLFFGQSDIGFGARESIADSAKVIAGMADFLVARTFSHTTLESLAEFSTIPVINGLSDLEHPCQILADFLTIFEIKKKLSGLSICYLGDGENNVAHSLALGCAMMGINFTCGSPKGYTLNKNIVKQAQQVAKKTKATFLETENPKVAINNADVVITDTWVSMGDEKEKAQRIKIFRPYQVNAKLMKLAKRDAIFMHCMPIHRGDEVTTEIVDGPQSVMFVEAENRLHVQKALLVWLHNN